MKEHHWLKEHWLILLTGVVVGIATLVLTAAGNPKNMGFCIACFERDIAGALKLHSAAKVQYIRPEIIGIVLGALFTAVAAKEFRGRAGSSPASRFIVGIFVMIGALVFLGCPLRMVIRLGGGDLRAAERIFVVDAVEEFIRHGKPVRMLFRFARPVIFRA